MRIIYFSGIVFPKSTPKSVTFRGFFTLFGFYQFGFREKHTVFGKGGLHIYEKKRSKNKMGNRDVPVYLHAHLLQIHKMTEEGIDVFGYCPWSFVDVVS